jgi:hypothetical protein
MASSSVLPRGDQLSALTNDHCCVIYLTWLSNAHHETPFTAHFEYYIIYSTWLSNAHHETPFTARFEYYDLTGQMKKPILYVECPLSLEQGRNIGQNCVLDAKRMEWIHHLSACKLLLRLVETIFSSLDGFCTNNILVELLLRTGRTQRSGCYIIIGFECLFLNRDLLHPCIVPCLQFRQSLYSKHDFRVLKKRLSAKFSMLWGIQLRTLATFLCNCACSQQHLKGCSAFSSMFKLISRIPLVFNHNHLLSRSDIVSSGQRTAGRRLNLGGGSPDSGSKLYKFSAIGVYLTSLPDEINQDSMFRYVAHVDNVGLLAYSSSQFVHANIPLSKFLIFCRYYMLERSQLCIVYP